MGQENSKNSLIEFPEFVDGVSKQTPCQSPICHLSQSPEPDVKASTESFVEQKSSFKKFFDLFSTKQASEPEVKSLIEPSIVTDTSGPIIKAAVDEEIEAPVDSASLSKETPSEDKSVPSAASKSPEPYSLAVPETEVKTTTEPIIETDPAPISEASPEHVDTSGIMDAVAVPIETSAEAVPAGEEAVEPLIEQNSAPIDKAEHVDNTSELVEEDPEHLVDTSEPSLVASPEHLRKSV